MSCWHRWGRRRQPTWLEGQHFDPEQRLYARSASRGCAQVIASALVRFERVTTAGGARFIRIAGNGDLIGQGGRVWLPQRDPMAANPSCSPRMAASWNFLAICTHSSIPCAATMDRF